MPQLKTQTEIEKDKQQKIMETIAWKAGYYRANPHRYVSEVLGLSLKWFQQILLWCMIDLMDASDYQAVQQAANIYKLVCK